MTEDEWLTRVDPEPLLDFLKGKANPRQYRHLAVSFVSPLVKEDFLLGKPLSQLCDILGAYAAGELARCDLDGAIRPFSKSGWLFKFIGWPWYQGDFVSPQNDAESAAHWRLHWGYLAAQQVFPREFGLGPQRRTDITAMLAETSKNSILHDSARQMCRAIRDIFGNPFRPMVADPAWLTPTVVSIADAIYQDRAFDRLPILADALEEAGCTNADLLLHCRQPGEHVRGCWAVDLVLGKE